MAIFRKKDADDKKTEREKVEERREEVLARGRKFKYPLQYAKHKVVNLTIIISILANDNESGLADSPYSFDNCETWQSENELKIELYFLIFHF